jgi:hypothetical protein
MNVRKMRPNERLDSTSTRSGERLNLKGEVIVSFFNDIDIGKELCSRFQVRSPDCCFIFLTSLLQERKLCSKPLFHFLMSLPQRRETMLVTSISFFNELTIEKGNYARYAPNMKSSGLCFIF